MSFGLLVNLGAGILAILAIYGFFVLARAYTKAKAAEAAASTNKILMAEIEALQFSRNRMMNDMDLLKSRLSEAQIEIATLRGRTDLVEFAQRTDQQWSQTMDLLARVAAKVLDEPVDWEKL